MADTKLTSLTVEMRKTEQGDHYQLGVNVGHKFVVFAALKAPEVEAQIAEAAEAAKAAKKSSTSAATPDTADDAT